MYNFYFHLFDIRYTLERSNLFHWKFDNYSLINCGYDTQAIRTACGIMDTQAMRTACGVLVYFVC